MQAHVHLDQALLDRGVVPDGDPFRYHGVQLASWLANIDEASVRTQASAAFSRGLGAGVTTFADGGRDGGRTHAIDAALELGVRLVAPLDATARDVAADLDAFAARLPARDPARRISLAIWAGDAERISLGRLRTAARRAGERGLPLLLHAGALPGDRGGLSRLDRAGALGKNLVLIHARAPGLGRDAKVLAQAGASVVLTPAADVLFGAPRPPLEAFLEAGVNLALGSETGATRLGFDVFREARLLLRLLGDRVPAPASTALEIATRGGARAFNLATGAIEVGRHADLIALDLDAADHEDHETLALRILERGTPDRIRTVWINGEVAAADGRTILGPGPSEADEAEVRRRLSAKPSAARTLARTSRAVLRRVLGV